MRRMATAAVAVALLVAGCGGSAEPAAVGQVPPPDTTAPTAPTSTTLSRAEVEQAVLDAYLANWDAYTAASDPADPEFPGVAETRTGPALERAQEQLAAYQFTGRVGRYPQGSIGEHRAEVVSVGGDEATVRDCNIDDGQLVVAATGEVVNDLVATVLFEGSMVVEDGRWKLRSLKVIEKWDGVAGCAVE